MRKRICLWLVPALAGVLFLYGCAGMRPQSNGPVRTVLEKMPSASQPEWTSMNERNYWIQNGSIYSSGYAESPIALQNALDEAENSARTKLIKNAKDMMLAEFQRALSVQKQDPKTQASVSSAFSALVSTMKVTGIAKKDSYSEKVREKLGKDEKIFYRSFVRVELANANYEKNLQQLLSGLKTQMKANKSARKLAEDIEKKIKERSK